MQSGFFDHEDRLAKLEKLSDPLPRLEGPRPRRTRLRRSAHAPGQHPGSNQGQGPGGCEDRTDESDLQHATVGISIQVAIRLLHGLSGRQRRMKRENWAAFCEDADMPRILEGCRAHQVCHAASCRRT